MKQFKKPLLSLGLLSIGIIPVLVVSCTASETPEETPRPDLPFFNEDGFRISSKGEIMGIDNSYIKDGTLKIEEEYSGVKIKYIADNAFEDNKLITKLSLPKSLVRIGKEAFKNSNISSINFNDANKLREIGPGAFLDNKITSLILPNSITTIGYAAFELNKLTSLILPDSITTIGQVAFAQNKITSLKIPNKLVTIRNRAFWGNQITSLTFPDSVTSIGAEAFANNQLTSLTLSNKLTIIEWGTFENNQLTSLTIPNSITTIEGNAFAKNQLTSLSIPDSVTSIDNDAFEGNLFTNTSQIILPAKFDTPEERKRIGIVITTRANPQNQKAILPLEGNTYMADRIKNSIKE
ncbi:MAG: leucine-rich repeat protein [Metamycoplasmataceae bacterium]